MNKYNIISILRDTDIHAFKSLSDFELRSNFIEKLERITIFEMVSSFSQWVRTICKPDKDLAIIFYLNNINNALDLFMSIIDNTIYDKLAIPKAFRIYNGNAYVTSFTYHNMDNLQLCQLKTWLCAYIFNWTQIKVKQSELSDKIDDMDYSIDILGLTSRTTNALKRNNIFTIYDLNSHKYDIMHMRNIGPISYKKIVESLKDESIVNKLQMHYIDIDVNEYVSILPLLNRHEVNKITTDAKSIDEKNRMRVSDITNAHMKIIKEHSNANITMNIEYHNQKYEIVGCVDSSTDDIHTICFIGIKNIITPPMQFDFLIDCLSHYESELPISALIIDKDYYPSIHKITTEAIDNIYHIVLHVQ